MVTVQEIVERTFYISLLHQTLVRGLTINPDDYLVDQGELRVPTKELYAKYEADKAAIEEKLKAIGSSFYYIFGIYISVHSIRSFIKIINNIETILRQIQACTHIYYLIKIVGYGYG